jgi:hypothetical protein
MKETALVNNWLGYTFAAMTETFPTSHSKKTGAEKKTASAREEGLPCEK